MTEFTEIPVLDAGALATGNDDAVTHLAAKFAEAYGTTGFGYIVNHGIDPALVRGVFDASARFHALPHAAKMAVELNHLHRGFIPINTSTDVNSKLAEVKRPNQSESFMMMREDGPDAPDVRAGAFLAGPNQWPELNGFRETVTAYHDALSELGRKLMAVAALSIGTKPDQILPAFDRPTTWLRLLHYPPTPPSSRDDLFGSAPHTDFGCLTILAQDDVGGLQVQTPAGAWIDAPVIPGAFVVNVGDMLHRLSNGRLLSTPHRVINRSGRERYSCPFFFDPNVATDIAPLPSCVTPDRPAAFSPINFGEFLRGELQAGYEKHKRSG
jgi:isopenicillin N synthase-like dioxygenase